MGLSASGAVPGGYSLSRIGALRSLICVTFFSLVPLQMSCRRAPRPRCSSRLSFGGSVFAWGQEAAQQELVCVCGHPKSQSRSTPLLCRAPRPPCQQTVQSNVAAPGGDVPILQGKLELLSYLSQKHSSVRATCNICSPQVMVEQKTLM